MGLTETLRLVIDGDPKGAVGALRDVRTEGDKTDKAVGKWGQHLNTAANYALGAGTMLAGVIGVSAQKTIAYGQSIDDMADLSNLSAEATSRLAGQLYYFDIGLENAGNSVKVFEKNLDAARQGNENVQGAFERLGISVEELQSMDDEELLFATRDAMADLDDKTARTAITLQLFGKSGADLADWLDAAPEDMKKLNAQLEEMGLVWDDKKVESWQDLVDAQREMRISTLGLQMAIADPQFVGSVSELVRQFTDFLQLIRPLMPAIPILTAGLFAFGGAVKAVRMYQFLRDLGRGSQLVRDFLSGWRDSRAAASAFSGSMGTVGGALRRLSTGGLAAARRGFSGLSQLVRNLPALLTSTGGMYGLIAAGIAVDTYLIYEAVKAWQALSDAIDQARQAEKEYADNSTQQLDRVREKYGENSAEYRKFYEEVKRINEQAQQDAYKYPWWYGPGAWLANMGLPLPGWKNTGDQIPGLANEGLVKASPGGTIVRLGEGGEDEVVLKASRFGKGGGAPSVSIDLRGARFGRASASEIIDELSDVLVPRLLDALAV